MDRHYQSVGFDRTELFRNGGVSAQRETEIRDKDDQDLQSGDRSSCFDNVACRNFLLQCVISLKASFWNAFLHGDEHFVTPHSDQPASVWSRSVSSMQLAIESCRTCMEDRIWERMKTMHQQNGNQRVRVGVGGRHFTTSSSQRKDP